MFNKSIAYKLSVYISVAVISVFLAFIIITFYFNNEIVKEKIESETITLGYQAMMLGEKQLVSTREVASNIAEQILYYANHQDVKLFISKILARYNFINAVHINIDPDVPEILYHNQYYFRAPDSIYMLRGNDVTYLCEVEQGIFNNMKKENHPGWTETFECHRNNKDVVAYFTPVQIHDEFNQTVTVGSVVLELARVDLNDTINSIKIGEEGYAFLVGKDGTYLTHPRKDYVMNKNLLNLSKKEFKGEVGDIKKVIESGLSGSIIAYPEDLDYQKCWIYYTPVKETGWTLVFVVPFNYMFEPLYIMILRMLFISVLGILIIFFIISFISNKLIQPLSNVTTQLKKFSSQGIETDLNTRNEVALVSESLDYIKSWYRKFEIEHQREEKLKNQRTQDLLEASEIQMSLINKDFSAFEKRDDIDLYASYQPAHIVSGDLFDFIFLDKDHLLFTIGDVSGKGLSASFFMSVAQTIIKGNSRLDTPGKIVNKTNNELYTVNQHQFFLTLFCGVLNLKTGILKYCNAAHTPLLILSANGEITAFEQPHGMPLGLNPDRVYEESALKLNPGDSIVLYTDGVTELQDANDQHFGRERFFQMLLHLAEFKPKLLIEEIEKNLDLFRGKRQLADDITILVLKYKDKKKAS